MRTLKTLEHGAIRLVTPGFRAGTEDPDFRDYEKTCELGHPVDLKAVGTVLDEAMHRFSYSELTDADVWLAPRLHYSFRMTRREAANRGIWRWMSVVFSPEYVRWRWGSPDTSSQDVAKAARLERFDGLDYKHALARLWWMAELFRDGPDYGPATKALANQDIPNNLFRMDVAHHRPTTQAAVRVLEGRSGREANALAKAVNSAASTIVLDVLAPDVTLDPEASIRWIEDRDIDPVHYFDVLPLGPDDPKVPDTSVDEMTELLNALLAEAPVRGRDQTSQ
ncbi:MAG: DUF6339 family protein [bacterium]|nr:DUF6339 family protein [bacterium]